MAVKGGRSLASVELPENVEARESQVDSLLADRVARFLGTHTLQFKVPKDSIDDMQRSLEEGRPRHEHYTCTQLHLTYLPTHLYYYYLIANR